LIIAPKPTNPFSSSVLLMYSFAAFIILGTILLYLPISGTSGNSTNFVTAMFTATSAVTLTGLSVVETGLYWSPFGQVVIYMLIQFGGLGFIVGATLMLLAIGGRFGLRDRLLIGESLGVDQVGGVIGLVIRVVVFTLVLQGLGALFFYLRWSVWGESGISLWTAIFHSTSAFHNSGFDIFGTFNSLAAYGGDGVTLLVTAGLIIFGSTGYVVFADLFRKRGFSKITLDTKIIFITTAGLIALGTLVYLAAEYSGESTLGRLPLEQKLAVAFFQSVSPRTAGFSVWDFNLVQPITLLFTIFLMFIGGAAGSTAGGIKVNTFGVLVIGAWNIFLGKEHIGAFGRQVTKQTVLKAMTLVLFYLATAAVIIFSLSIIERISIDKIIFETISALSTVGLSTGITAELSSPSKYILMAAMFMGRLAPLALLAYIAHHKQNVELEYPHEDIRLG
jgi:trk system potassium uptake protein TrkH